MSLSHVIRYGVVAVGLVSLVAEGASLPNMLAKRDKLAAATDAQGRVYAIGGDEGTSKPTVERFDPATGKWERVTDAPQKLFGAAAVTVEGNIYVIGGEKRRTASSDYNDQVLMYDVADGTWTSAGKIKGPRKDLAATAVGNKIYSVGGAGPIYGSPAPAVIVEPREKYYLDAWGIRFAEVFDLGQERSRTIEALPRRRAENALVADKDGTLYAIGGWFQGDFYGYPSMTTEIGRVYINDTIEAYDADSDEWKLVTRLPLPRFGLAAVTGKDGKIYTFGGVGVVNGRRQVTDAVEAWDPVAKRWERKKAMPVGRAGHAAVLGNDGKIYVVGGRDKAERTRGLLSVYDPATDTWETSVEETNPDEEVDFETVEGWFKDASSTVPSRAKLAQSWWAGRCYSADDATTPLAGLLVGDGLEEDMKVVMFRHESPDQREFFDQISEEEEEEIQELLSSESRVIDPAEELRGALTSRLERHSEATGTTKVWEYQVKALANDKGFVTRAVNVSASRKTTMACVHRTKVK